MNDLDYKPEEIERCKSLSVFEREAFLKGHRFIAGVDEAGRGPLAGPVVAAAVILPQDCIIPGVNDSKKINESKRESLFEVIQNTALAVGVGIASHDVIDKINILQATFEAMRQAISQLSIVPDICLVDGNRLIPHIKPQMCIVDGDAKSISIASASIIAKVTRDRIMREYNTMYPGYNFSSNKGYPTEEHIRIIREIGICPIHRKSFEPICQLKIEFDE